MSEILFSALVFMCFFSLDSAEFCLTWIGCRGDYMSCNLVSSACTYASHCEKKIRKHSNTEIGGSTREILEKETMFCLVCRQKIDSRLRN